MANHSDPIRTTCPYCGVGCGLLVSQDTDAAPTIKGDPEHPANLGRLCSKGSALGETLALDGRLLYPQVDGQRYSWESTLDRVAQAMREAIRTHGPDGVALYLSGQLLTEDYYVANKLMKGFIGSANVDTNSRLCMSSAVAAYKRAFGADAVPCSYTDLEQADLVVLAGSNTAWCHPVIYQRLVREKQARPALRIVVLDPRRTDTCDIADIHLPLRPGTDAVLFNGLLCYLADHDHLDQAYIDAHTEGFDEALAAARAAHPTLDAVAAACELKPALLERFYSLFARTEKVVTAWSQGLNQSSSGTDKGNALINCHLATGRLGKPGMGPFSLTGQPNAMGGREVGGLANTLAAHMEFNSADIERVRRFWNAAAMATRPGYKALELVEAIEAGKVRFLWVLGTNPLVSLPDNDRVRRAFAKLDTLVVSDCVDDTDTLRLAHIRLPALAWGEKSGTVTNSERRISRQRPFLPLPGEARADWWALAQVAARLGFGHAFAYRNAAEIFSEHAALSAYDNHDQRDFDLSALTQLDTEAYDALQPIQWPVTPRRPHGTPRLFSDARFYTPNGRARLLPITPRPPQQTCSAALPLTLNTGRVRDHWHTLTRTGRSARLSRHVLEPIIQVEPQDADEYGLVDGTLARVESAHGTLVGRVRIDPAQRRGSLFVPMHWNDVFASQGRVGALIAAHADPVSGQPESKQTPVRILPWSPSWHGFLLTREACTVAELSGYWVRAQGKGYLRYELAGEQAPGDWAAQARALLGGKAPQSEWIEYFDVARQTYRAARLQEGRLQSTLFIGHSAQLPPRDWLEGLFSSAEPLQHAQRVALLSGLPPRGEEERGRTICACGSVGEATLRKAILEQGLDSVEAIGAATGAGTHCGSCVPELRRLLAEVRGAQSAA